MTGFVKRCVNLLGAVDRVLAVLFGSLNYQTISGNAGRACGYGGGEKRWWGRVMRWAIDIEPWFGMGHCQRWAESEQRVGMALAAAGLDDI